MVDFTREGILAGKPEAQDDAKDAMWCPLNLINDIKLAFHHRQIIDNALKLRQTL
jgi:hypothetical protein